MGAKRFCWPPGEPSVVIVIGDVVDWIWRREILGDGWMVGGGGGGGGDAKADVARAGRVRLRFENDWREAEND
jgi:hypothetical protein